MHESHYNYGSVSHAHATNQLLHIITHAIYMPDILAIHSN